jgi:hypothetical protein
LHELQTTQPDDRTDFALAFGELAQQIRRRGLVVLLSDLFVPRAALADALQQFRLRRHELVVFQILHGDELSFPFTDHTLFRGLEEAAQAQVEPRALRKSYLAAIEAFIAEVRGLCARSGVDHVLMRTSDPLDAVLGRYLAFRQKVRRGTRARGR